MKNTAPRPFEIYGASALSRHKKQSSTYSKYACGCFLYAPSICIVYFKRLTESRILPYVPLLKILNGYTLTSLLLLLW